MTYTPLDLLGNSYVASNGDTTGFNHSVSNHGDTSYTAAGDAGGNGLNGVSLLKQLSTLHALEPQRPWPVGRQRLAPTGGRGEGPADVRTAQASPKRSARGAKVYGRPTCQAHERGFTRPRSRARERALAAAEQAPSSGVHCGEFGQGRRPRPQRLGSRVNRGGSCREAKGEKDALVQALISRNLPKTGYCRNFTTCTYCANVGCMGHPWAVGSLARFDLIEVNARSGVDNDEALRL
jgi:hypothetical protein